LHHIEDQEENSQEGVTYEEALSSDEDEGIIHNNNLVDNTKCVGVSG
jgi:Tfp pilus assembly protein PilF